MSNNKIKTKYGKAALYENYYQIYSKKEGNYRKKVHRLVFEDYYKISILPGVDVHHKDGNKTNNDIDNLELMYHENHTSFHHKNKFVSNETKMKISESNKNKVVSLDTREKISNSLKGRPFSNETKQKISDSKSGKNHHFYNKSLSSKHKIKISKSNTSTGIYRVTKEYNSKYNNGFIFQYRYYENGKYFKIRAVDIYELEEKIFQKGLMWRITDPAKAKEILVDGNKCLYEYY